MSSTDRDKADKLSQVASSIAFKHSQGVILPQGVNGLAADIDTALAEARREAWEAAIVLLDTAPGCHSAGKWYIDPVALVQRMNAALESAKGER